MSRANAAAVITGASAGMGRDYARLFAADGYDVVLVARRQQRLEDLAAELTAKHGVEARVVAADLTEPDAPTEIYRATADMTVECLVNNAGYGTNGPFIEQDTARELGMIDVNVRALVHLTRLYLPAMLERKRGHILNIGSTAGFQAGPYMATYYASKAFVNHFSEALWHELAGTGVTVTVSCPGPVETEFGEVSGNGRSNLFKGGGANSAAVAREAYRGMMRGKRMVVHGLRNQMLVHSLRLSPRSVVHKIAARLNKPA